MKLPKPRRLFRIGRRMSPWFRRGAPAPGLVLLLFFAGGSTLGCVALLPGRTSEPPRLTVMLVVDQMRADYLERFGPLFTGGFARLLERGAVFTDAHQDHAATVTAVGHATLSTGELPAHHGIVGNEFIDRSEGRVVYAASDSAAPILGFEDAPGRSPVRLLREGLADWLETADTASRTFSVALKDRSAIMLGGRSSDAVYWYHAAAHGFTTSEYYAPEIPQWVVDFDAPGRIAGYFDLGWDRMLPEEAYAHVSQEDGFEAEGQGGRFAFPYDFTKIYPDSASEGPGEAFFQNFPRTPFADEVVLQFARAAVVHENLGSDAVPDLLLIGASAGDYIGHRWGPYSQEVEDYYLRLDGYLGELFDFLDERVGPDAWSFALSSDHGVAPAPEETVRRGGEARRVPATEYRSVIQSAIEAALDEVAIEPRPEVRFFGGAYILSEVQDERELRELRLALARRLEAAEFVGETFTLDEIMAADLWGSDAVSLFRRSFYPERSPDVALLIKPFYLVGRTPASHGTAHPYDTHVPLIFMGPGIAAGEHDRWTRTIDVAPTLARLMGLEGPEDLDGRVLESVVRRSP